MANNDGVTEEDHLRARFYGLLASLLAAPPSPALLEMVGGLEASGDSEMGAALADLAAAARATTPVRAEEEFNALFIGMVRGEVVPYGSFYRTGFLNEKPLAVLRADMCRLGIERAEGVPESEDHIVPLCEMMQGLIEGGFGDPLDLAGQKVFFAAHIGPWAGRLFKDIEASASAVFYKPVARVGRLFMEIEAQGFEMV